MLKQKQMLINFLNRVPYLTALAYIKDLNEHIGYPYIAKDEIEKTDLGFENQISNLEIEFEILKSKIKFENQKEKMKNQIQISEYEFQKHYMKLLSENLKQN